jgi:6-phosphofructokinase
MSVERCIEALTRLGGDLNGINAAHDLANTRASTRAESLEHLIRDLTLDVDLRHNELSHGSMTAVETEIYLPAIERILALLSNHRSISGLMATTRVAEAEGLARGAIGQASKRLV